MSSVIRFTNTKVDAGRVGELKADADGYYNMIIGGLNVYNSSGDYYAAEGAKELFSNSSTFMRRVKSGYLRGEVGHPVMLPGMTTQAYIQRCMTIQEDNVCVHFADITLDFDRIKDDNGRSVIAVIGKFRPSGAKADTLERSLANKFENTAFSLRGFTEDTRMPSGNLNRVIKSIVSYDHVLEPGISLANKFDSAKNGIGLESLNDKIVSQTTIETILGEADNGLATESVILAKDLLKTISGGYALKEGFVAKYTKW
jgi:hypothetical protein